MLRNEELLRVGDKNTQAALNSSDTDESKCHITVEQGVKGQEENESADKYTLGKP